MIYEVTRPLQRAPSHPGALLRHVISATGRTKADIARLLGISRQQLYSIIGERRPVSPATAARLGRLFDNGAEVWLKMQASYDAWHAERSPHLAYIERLDNPGRRE